MKLAISLTAVLGLIAAHALSQTSATAEKKEPPTMHGDIANLSNHYPIEAHQYAFESSAPQVLSPDTSRQYVHGT